MKLKNIKIWKKRFNKMTLKLKIMKKAVPKKKIKKKSSKKSYVKKRNVWYHSVTNRRNYNSPQKSKEKRENERLIVPS